MDYGVVVGRLYKFSVTPKSILSYDIFVDFSLNKRRWVPWNAGSTEAIHASTRPIYLPP